MAQLWLLMLLSTEGAGGCVLHSGHFLVVYRLKR